MAELVKVVLATSNEGKLREFRALLDRTPIELVSVRAFLGRALDVEETGATFEENAILKARAVCQATGAIALADDSGLEVDALSGRPGVRSARYAGERASDGENNALLLSELGGTSQRRARFRCALALCIPGDARARTVAGSCEGTIGRAPSGSGGFGYDPVFLPDGFDGRSMAALSPAEKNAISHRGRAVEALQTVLLELSGRTPDASGRT